MKKAFSLIELLIYTGLFAVAAGLLTGITLTVTRVQTQESAGLEVTRQSQFIMQRIQNLVRGASLVEDGCEGKISSFSPLPSCPSSQCTGDFCFLKLRTEVSGADPTYIYIPSGTDGVYLKQGSSDAVALTTDKVKVGMLKFSKIANPGGHSIVNVDLTLNYNSTNPILSGASKRLTSAVSRVSAATFDSNLLPNADNTWSIGAAGTPGAVPTWKNILMVNGAAASPSYSFGASSTTGIFSPGAGIIGFSTVGSERMRIDASGNVGIGTTSPTNILSLGNASVRKFWIENTAAGTVGRALTIAAGGTVAGTADITGGNLILQAGLGTGTGASDISFQTGTTLTTGTTLQTMSTKMTILGNGNVGIGTASPGQKLSVAGTIESTSGGFKFPDSTTQVTAASSQWITSGSNIYYTGSMGSGLIAFRAAAFTDLNASSLTLVINVPTGTVNEDVMLAGIAIRPNTAVITAPAGWTLVLRQNTALVTANSLAVYRRVASSEPASYTWSFDSSQGSAGGIISFSNVNTVSPVDVSGGSSTSAATVNIDAPSVTTTQVNTMLVTFHGFSSAERWSPPSGMAESFDVASIAVPSTSGEAIEGNYVAQSLAGATGVKTAIAAGSADNGNGITVALAPRSSSTEGKVGISTTAPGANLEIASAAQNALRLKKTAGAAGSVDLFPAVGDATTRTGTALCQTVVGAAVCLGHWQSTGTASTCITSIANGRALCTNFGD